MRPWLPTGKVYEAVTAVFLGFEFELIEDEVRVVKEKLGTSC